MATHEIAEKDWAAYFETFTERRKGSLVSIEDVDPTSQPSFETHDLPFVSITYHRDASGGPAIELITAEKDAGAHRTHRIAAPKEVYHKSGAGVMSSEVNPDEVLEITSGAKPPVYYITFRDAA